MAGVNWRNIRIVDCDIPDILRRAVVWEHGPEATLGYLDGKTDAELSRSADIGRKSISIIRALISTARDNARERGYLPGNLPMIDWMRLARAVEFYRQKGYRYIEAPWAVSAETSAITCPSPKFTAEVAGLGSLVGSAEQSFLQLQQEGLPEGYYMAVTPCFRLGDYEDDLHFPYFMKLELYLNIQEEGARVIAFMKMLQEAGELFRELGATKDNLQARPTEEGVDIELNGIEIGSYGLRESANLKWVYGTGLALPRFTQALQRFDLGSD